MKIHEYIQAKSNEKKGSKEEEKKKKENQIKFYWIYHFSARFDVKPCIEKSSMQEFLPVGKSLNGILLMFCCSVHCIELLYPLNAVCCLLYSLAFYAHDEILRFMCSGFKISPIKR